VARRSGGHLGSREIQVQGLTGEPDPHAAEAADRRPIRPLPPWALLLTALVAGLPWARLPLAATRDPFADPKWPLLAGALAVWLAMTQRSAARRRVGPFELALGLIAVGLVISVLFSPAPRLGLRLALREGLFLVLAFRLAELAVSRGCVLGLFGAYAASAAAQAALTLYQWFPGGPPPNGRMAMWGTLGNPEYVAGWMAPALAAAMAWLAHGASAPSRRWALGGAVMLIGAALFLSGGRGGALGAVTGALAGIFVGRRGGAAERGRARPRRRWERLASPLGAGLVGLLVLVGALALVLGPETRRQTLLGRLAELADPYSLSTRHRVGLMVVTSRMIAEQPIVGVGPGRFGAAFDQARGALARESPTLGPWVFNDLMRDYTATEAHCDPLQWWAEYGLLPLVGLLTLLTAGIGNPLRRLRTEAGGIEDRLILAALVALAVVMLFSFPLHRPARATTFWVLIGLSQASGRRAPSS